MEVPGFAERLVDVRDVAARATSRGVENRCGRNGVAADQPAFRGCRELVDGEGTRGLGAATGEKDNEKKVDGSQIETRPPTNYAQR
jgi:hypothetical protein